MTTLVLVHGLWSDGSAWSGTITELRALGRDSVAAQLPLESLESDVAAVRRVLSVIEGPVLLVGWSYGGAVITNAAVGQSHVKALSYLAAFAPEEGETVRDIVQRRPGSLIPQHLKFTRPSCVPGRAAAVRARRRAAARAPCGPVPRPDPFQANH